MVIIYVYSYHAIIYVWYTPFNKEPDTVHHNALTKIMLYLYSLCTLYSVAIECIVYSQDVIWHDVSLHASCLVYLTVHNV